MKVNQIQRGTQNWEGLPFFLKGIVINGFGRGSKKLGIPTANLPIEPYENLLKSFPLGVYCGWVNINGGPVYKMAMNIGWVPFFQNKKKSVEIHIIHKFEEDFYGQELRAIAIHYLRNELNFSSIDDLIQAIKDDISYSEEYLEKPENKIYQTNSFFFNNNNN
jgi:riboflavin kinase